MTNNKFIIAILIVIIVAAAAAAVLMGRPSSLPPLTTAFPKDENHFTVSSGRTTGPQLREGYVDSFYPAAPGDMQTLSIKATDNTPIISMQVTLQTDYKQATYPLALTEGEATNGLWKGSWKVSDTHKNVYDIIIYARDKFSSSSVQITLK